jgi:hypothetical protein
LIDHHWGRQIPGTSIPGGRAEEAADFASYGVWFALETPVGDSDRAISGGLAGGVFKPIGLEGGSMPVEGIAVELDYQTLARPKGIYLVSEDLNVCRRGDQVVFSTKEGKALLEGA